MPCTTTPLLSSNCSLSPSLSHQNSKLMFALIYHLHKVHPFEVYTLKSLSNCIQSCNYHHNTDQNHPLTLRNPSCPCAVAPCPPPASCNHWSALCHYNLAFSRITHKCSHVIYHLLCLTSFTLASSF